MWVFPNPETQKAPELSDAQGKCLAFRAHRWKPCERLPVGFTAYLEETGRGRTGPLYPHLHC